MNQLPIIPSPGLPISFSDVVAIETNVAQQIAAIDDVTALEDMRHKADALATWLRGKELHGPMLGAQRRIEARIGQLLGEARNGGDSRREHFPRVGSEIKHTDRERFRLLARGFGLLTDEEWRQSRTKLLAYLREKYPVPRHQSAVIVQKNGRVKKVRAVRVKEIATLAHDGNNAAQIAGKLNLDEDHVRRLAKQGEVRLPDEDIGRVRRIDPVRVIRETITGIEAYADGLLILEAADLPVFEAREQGELLQSLSRSINALRKLHRNMRSSYGDKPERSGSATA